MRVVEHRRPSWSDDGRTIFLGLQDRTPVEKKEGEGVEEEGDEGGKEGEGEEGEGEEEGEGAEESGEAEEGEGEEGEGEEDEDPPGVEIWHSRDVDPVPQQRVRDRLLRQRNHIGRWRLEEGSFLLLGGDHADRASVAEGGRHMIARDETPYDVDAMFRQQAYDLYVVDAASGRRELVRERLFRDYGASPGGRYLLWFEGEDYWTHDLRRGETRNITEGLGRRIRRSRPDAHPRTDARLRHAGVARGTTRRCSSTTAGTSGRCGPTARGGRRLTRGAEDYVRHRVVRLDPRGRTPSTRTSPSTTPPTDSGRRRPASPARAAETLPGRSLGKTPPSACPEGCRRPKTPPCTSFARSASDDSPDYFVTDGSFTDARQVTATNPFQDDYAWGRTELIDYENEWGRKLQGSLTYPARHEAGRKYPMIVLPLRAALAGAPPLRGPGRDRLLQRPGLEPGRVLRAAAGTSCTATGAPAQSNVETLRPAVAAAVATGMIDPERVGLAGHSWGGYQTTFFVTQDDLFAAAVAGAPLTNLMSMYLSFYWNSGGTDARIFEISQGRMQVPWWEDWDSYYDNSPVHHIRNLNTPLLMMFGREDGAVEFNQGVEFYNAARRAGKDMVLLVYDGENHGLRKESNQKDYRNRIMQWFAHYLKGEPAPDWIAKGLSYIEQQDGLNRRKRRPVS